jgi:AcrR family transcriptional regulator
MADADLKSADLKDRPRERLQADVRKDQIVQTVLKLVGERGADAVSTQLIADSIGRSQGIVFRHFPTKEALWSDVIGWLQENLEQVWTRAIAPQRAHQPPLQRLKQIFLGHLEMIQNYPALAQIVMSDHLRHEYPSIDDRFKTLHLAYDKHVKGLLDEAVRAGEVSRTIDVEDAATLYFCAIQGLGFQFAIAGLRSNQLKKHGARIFALFLRALASERIASRLDEGQRSRAEGSDK